MEHGSRWDSESLPSLEQNCRICSIDLESTVEQSRVLGRSWMGLGLLEFLMLNASMKFSFGSCPIH